MSEHLRWVWFGTIAFCVLLWQRNTFQPLLHDVWTVELSCTAQVLRAWHTIWQQRRFFCAVRKTHLHSFVSLIRILLFSFISIAMFQFRLYSFFYFFLSSLSLVYVSGTKRHSELSRFKSCRVPGYAKQRTSNLHFLSFVPFWLRLRAQFHLYLSLCLFRFFDRITSPFCTRANHFKCENKDLSQRLEKLFKKG